MNLPHRPRRNRRTPAIRGLVRETLLTPADFIYPLFFHEGPRDEPIVSMPGCQRWSLEGLVAEATAAWEDGVSAVVLFPAIPEPQKTPGAEESYHAEGLVPRAIRALKSALPGLAVITDVALDPYNSHGHDGLVKFDPDGQPRILNDDTVAVLCRQALCHAAAGADIVSPSDMMDGRVGAIREALDGEGYEDVSILSYTAKYASAFYGPFRGALDSAPKAGDKKTYQMDRSRPGSHLPFSTQRAYDTGKENFPPLFPVQYRHERCRRPVNVSNQRFHDETGTGPLTNPNGAQPKGRRSYTASWFDRSASH